MVFAKDLEFLCFLQCDTYLARYPSSPHPKHIKDDLVPMDDKANITHHISGLNKITVIVQSGVTKNGTFKKSH